MQVQSLHSKKFSSSLFIIELLNIKNTKKLLTLKLWAYIFYAKSFTVPPAKPVTSFKPKYTAFAALKYLGALSL